MVLVQQLHIAIIPQLIQRRALSHTVVITHINIQSVIFERLEYRLSDQLAFYVQYGFRRFVFDVFEQHFAEYIFRIFHFYIFVVICFVGAGGKFCHSIFHVCRSRRQRYIHRIQCFGKRFVLSSVAVVIRRNYLEVGNRKRGRRFVSYARMFISGVYRIDLQRLETNGQRTAVRNLFVIVYDRDVYDFGTRGLRVGSERRIRHGTAHSLYDVSALVEYRFRGVLIVQSYVQPAQHFVAGHSGNKRAIVFAVQIYFINAVFELQFFARTDGNTFYRRLFYGRRYRDGRRISAFAQTVQIRNGYARLSACDKTAVYFHAVKLFIRDNDVAACGFAFYYQ